jgi:ferrochelatase
MALSEAGQGDDRAGVLLVNLGTPEAPTPAALRRYLGEFLWDPRVVEIPRPIWWLILHLFVLRIRPRKSAKAYRKIWTEQGSPLRVFTQDLGRAVQQAMAESCDGAAIVETAMRYGEPSIRNGLERLRQAGVRRIVILPLYPQYAAPSTGSAFDAVARTVESWRYIPELGFISDYHANRGYIDRVAASIRQYRAASGKAHYLLFSFHGLPERSRAQGDPYYDQCRRTARLLAESLALADADWALVFQSRFGAQKWLQPYCVDFLKELPGRGIREVDVVCPGFAVDCLETLEEIAMTNRDFFFAAGGTDYRYIPALNATPEHAKVLAGIVLDRLAASERTG